MKLLEHWYILNQQRVIEGSKNWSYTIHLYRAHRKYFKKMGFIYFFRS